MVATPVLFNMYINEGVKARFFINDVPLMKGLRTGPDSGNGGLNPWLAPGSNTLKLELLHAPLSIPNAPAGDQTVEAVVYVVTDPTTRPVGHRPLHALSFPHMWDELPEEERNFPFTYEGNFEIELPEQITPAFMKAVPQDFPDEGSGELRDAVREIHDSLAQADRDKFLDLMSMQFNEYARAYAGHGGTSVGDQEKILREFFEDPFDVSPLDFDELIFERRADGRVAHVTRKDGDAAIMAVSQTDPRARLRNNLLLTHSDGRWRAF